MFSAALHSSTRQSFTSSCSGSFPRGALLRLHSSATRRGSSGLFFLSSLFFFKTGKIISSLPSLAINSRQADGPSATKPLTAELINPDSLQTCVFSSYLPHLTPPTKPSDPAPSPGSLFTHSRLSSYLCPPTTAAAKGSEHRARFHVCRPTDCCLAWLCSETAKLPWQSSPRAEEMLGFILSTKALAFMQLV